MSEMDRSQRLAFAVAAEEFFFATGHTVSKIYAEAVKDAMRLSADVIVIGEANPNLAAIANHLTDPLGYRHAIPAEIDNAINPGAWRETDEHLPRAAGVLVELVPIGQPGHVGIVVRNVGPEKLSRDEVVRTLRAAADQMEKLGEPDS